MRRKQKMEIILAPPAAMEAPIAIDNLEAAIESMIKKRVDEALSRIGMVELDDPHFRPREVERKARQVENMFERKKWSLYFERWGCVLCGQKKAAHMHTGYCNTCAGRITQRLRLLKRDYEQAHPEAEIDRQIEQLTLRARSAERLFRGEREE
ncbi:MAG TPA: hypothetical protein VFE02_10190 [Candidatus Acidoferrales bacterium]|jgi:hypothetical protein|nr:hypothetical protein [Candidatus Acidoferrales bacterium]